MRVENIREGFVYSRLFIFCIFEAHKIPAGIAHSKYWQWSLKAKY